MYFFSWVQGVVASWNCNDMVPTTMKAVVWSHEHDNGTYGGTYSCTRRQGNENGFPSGGVDLDRMFPELGSPQNIVYRPSDGFRGSHITIRGTIVVSVKSLVRRNLFLPPLAE